MLRSIKQLLFRHKPGFAPGDDVEFITGDMLCPDEAKLTVVESRYYPFGFYGSFRYARPAEYRYTVALWNKGICTDVRERQIRKRD